MRRRGALKLLDSVIVTCLHPVLVLALLERLAMACSSSTVAAATAVMEYRCR